MNKLNDARLKKQLDKVWKFDSFGKTTFRELFNNNRFIHKLFLDQTFSSKRIHLEYEKLSKPKRHYYLYYSEKGSFEVSKLIYDWAPVPEVSNKGMGF